MRCARCGLRLHHLHECQNNHKDCMIESCQFGKYINGEKQGCINDTAVRHFRRKFYNIWNEHDDVPVPELLYQYKSVNYLLDTPLSSYLKYLKIDDYCCLNISKLRKLVNEIINPYKQNLATISVKMNNELYYESRRITNGQNKLLTIILKNCFIPKTRREKLLQDMLVHCKIGNVICVEDCNGVTHEGIIRKVYYTQNGIEVVLNILYSSNYVGIFVEGMKMLTPISESFPVIIKPVLDDFLHGKIQQSRNIRINPPETIKYHHTLDDSQIRAFEVARGHRISVIQGPPGTGKKKVIATIAEAVARQQQKVLILCQHRNTADHIASVCAREGCINVVRHSQLYASTVNDENVVVTHSLDAEYLRKFNVFVSTVNHYIMHMFLKNVNFDRIIINESGVIPVAYFWYILQERIDKMPITLIGDLLQLEPSNKGFPFSPETAKSYFLTTSGMAVMLEADAPTVMLNHCYRGPADAGYGAIFRKYYPAHDISYHLQPDAVQLGELQTKVYKVRTHGQESLWQHGSKQNVENAHAVKALVHGLLDLSISGEKINHEDIMVLTPYIGQKILLSKMLPSNIVVQTINSSQGQECKLVVVDIPNTSYIGFLHDEHISRTLYNGRLTVALTRATVTTIVVCNHEMLQNNSLSFINEFSVYPFMPICFD